MAGRGLGVASGGIWWPNVGCVVVGKGLGWCCPATWREVGEREREEECVCECVFTWLRLKINTWLVFKPHKIFVC